MKQQIGELPSPERILSLSWNAYFEPPPSWSQKKRTAAIGKIHRVTPDRDNLDKQILDTLFERDEAVGVGSIGKYWAETARVEITIEYEEETDAIDSRSGGATGPKLEGSRKAEVRPRVGSPRTRRVTGHESVPVEHLLA